ncbi:28694_t:CDS:2, partial [Gigaspora margarita]
LQYKIAEDNFVQLLFRLGEEFKRSEEYVRLKSITKEFQRCLDNGKLHFDEFGIYRIIKTVIWFHDEKGLLYSCPKDKKAYEPTQTTILVTYMPLNRQGRSHTHHYGRDKNHSFAFHYSNEKQIVTMLSLNYQIYKHLNLFSTWFIWCQKCETKWFESEFNKWTSRDSEIDKYLQATQKDAPNELMYLEWILYKRLEKIEKVKNGGFETVYSAIWKDGPRKKSVNYLGSVLDKFLPKLNAYYNCSAIINHVPYCFGITKTPEKEYMIVMEYANEGDLRTFLSKSGEYPSWSLCKLILEHIALGLKTVHDAKKLHCDLHPRNILVFKDHDEKLYIAVGDLGLCHDINAPNENNQKNNLYEVISYIAPELLRNSKHTFSTDIYSFGMVAYKITSFTEPFYD